MRYLFVFSGKNIDQMYMLTAETVYIGRENSANIILPDKTVSSLHARIIRLDNEDYILEDLMSTRGTLVNNVEVFSKIQLNVNDIVQFGKIKCLYTDSDDSQKAMKKFLTTSRNTFLQEELKSYVQRADTDMAASGTVNEKFAETLNELLALYEISNIINSTFDSREIFHAVLKKVSSHFDAKNAALFFIKDNNFDLAEGNVLCSSVIQQSFSERETCIEIFEHHQKKFTAVCGVFSEGEQLAGAIYLEVEKEGITKKEQSFFSAVCTQLCHVAEKDRFLKEISEKEKMKKEIEIASSIQNGLLPQYQPFIPGIDIFLFYSFAKNVGGDSYFVYRVGERFLFFIMDAAGKGMQGALISVMVKCAIRAAVHSSLSVNEILDRCNKVLYEELHQSLETELDLYATMFIGVFDPADNSLIYANAGHEFPIISKRAGLQYLTDGNMPLGWLSETRYDSFSEKFEENDVLLLFSDGLIEVDADSRKSEEDRIQETMRACRDQSCREIVETLVKQAKIPEEPGMQYDDITVMAIKKLPGIQCFFEKFLGGTEQYRVVRKNAEKFLQNYLQESDVDNAMICVDEAVSNAIRHGNHNDMQKQVILAINYDKNLKICVSDEGNGFYSGNYRYADLRAMAQKSEIRGRGISMIQKCCSEIYSYREHSLFHFVMAF